MPGSRAQAEAAARRLLASVVFPPHARAVGNGPVPGQLRRPEQVPGSGHLIQRHQIRVVDRPGPWVLAFLRRHVPAGLTETGSGSSGLISRPVEFVMWTERHPVPGLYEAELVVSVLAAGHGQTYVRADAQVIWYPPRSRAEYIRPARFRAVRLTATVFNPHVHTSRRTFTSRPIIARLAGTLNGLHADPGLVYMCPVSFAEYRVTFVPRAPAQPRIVAVPDGCNGVGMTVGGMAQPGLVGGETTIALAARLTGTRSMRARR